MRRVLTATACALACAMVTLAAPSAGAAATSTRFGVAVQRQSGETYAQAVQRAVGTYGELGVIRRYYSGLPASWPTIEQAVGSIPVVVSFKANARAVTSGRYDDRLRSWFAAAPTDRPTYWVYFHEPEDNIAAGSFTAAQFRAAWKHVYALAAEAGNPQLRATLTLMCYTLETRNWRDYFAGAQYVDILAWDCYNKRMASDRYGDPAGLFSQAIETTQDAGLPVAIAEFGAMLLRRDDGSSRAEWLTQCARYLADHHAVFVSYFDTDVHGDFRLLDKPSQQAWRAVVTGDEESDG